MRAPRRCGSPAARVGARLVNSPLHNKLLAVIVGLAIVAVLALASTRQVNFGRATNWGFGPEWQCAPTEKGALLCVKKR
jgi:hypothetical protein